MVSEVARTLQFGTAGLFVLLPVLAYKIVIAMLTVEKVDPAVVRSFYWFLVFETVLGVLYFALKIREGRSKPRQDDGSNDGAKSIAYTEQSAAPGER